MIEVKGHKSITQMVLISFTNSISLIDVLLYYSLMNTKKIVTKKQINLSEKMGDKCIAIFNQDR